MRNRLLILILASLAAYAATGLYTVQPDEQAVVRRFGRALPLRDPGLHFGLPWGLDQVDRLKPHEIKRTTIGPIDVGGEAVGRSPNQYLTGDHNLVDVQAIVQYTIEDPVAYLFHTGNVDSLVRATGEAALSQILATEGVDHVLTQGKLAAARTAQGQLEQLVNSYGLGISIRSVDISRIRPPAEVVEAFDDVLSAQRQLEQQVNQAESYRIRVAEQARAEAQRILDEGHAFHEQRVRQAEGDAERFEKLLAQYQQSPELTASRLYLQAMAETLPKFRSKLIIDNQSEMDLSILRGEQR